jgi:HlyD family secretion protein
MANISANVSAKNVSENLSRSDAARSEALRANVRSRALWSKLEPAVLKSSNEFIPPSPPTDDVRSRWRLLKWPLVFLVCVVVAAGALLTKGGSAAAEYVTAPAVRGDIVRTTVASGMVNPVETVQVGSYVSGRIQDLLCDYNTQVVKGQSCAKIDPRGYQAMVDQSAAAVSTAKAQLSKDQAQLAYAKVTYERNLALLNRNVVSQDATDNALNAYKQTEAQVALDQAAIAQRQAGLESAKVNLDYTDIVSPVDGTVVSRSAAIGQTVTANFQTPTLFLIAKNLKQMQVEANVSEAEIGAVRQGQNATFTVEAFPGRMFSGKVTQIRQAPVAVQNVISYDVVISADNSDLALKPGMTATAHIVTAERHDVLRIPEAALRFAPKGYAVDHASAGERIGGLVWVERKSGLEPIAVQLGLADGDEIEVTHGAIEPGDQVVTGLCRAGEAPSAATSSAQDAT